MQYSCCALSGVVRPGHVPSWIRDLQHTSRVKYQGTTQKSWVLDLIGTTPAPSPTTAYDNTRRKHCKKLWWHRISVILRPCSLVICLIIPYIGLSCASIVNCHSSTVGALLDKHSLSGAKNVLLTGAPGFCSLYSLYVLQYCSRTYHTADVDVWKWSSASFII